MNMTMNKRTDRVFEKSPYIMFALLAFALSACNPGAPTVDRISNAGNDDGIITTPLGQPGDDGNGGDDDGEDNGGSCVSGDTETQNFTLNPDAVNGANVVFLIDESGSMSGEMAKVGSNLQNFADQIAADTSNNYKILFVYNSRIRSNAALNDTVRDNPNVNRVDSETFSKYADIAFFRAFAKTDYIQVLPDLLPLDSADAPNPAPLLPADCGDNDFWRPRAAPWSNKNYYNTPGCVVSGVYDNNGVLQHPNLSDYLLPGIAVNIIGISDDDLNVAWDRSAYTPASGDDPAAPGYVASSGLGYPEVTDLMFRQVLRESGLNENYIYHSIVGFDSGASGVEEVGEAHLALSSKTIGEVYDITRADWSPLFDDLTLAIQFSEQKADLSCTPRPDVQVFFNNTPVSDANFIVEPSEMRVRLLPAAFEGYSGDIVVKVVYQVL